MASSASKEQEVLPLEKSMAGILALLIDERTSRIGDDTAATKTEILLAAAGLSARDIASLLGKNYDAVAKTIQRGKK